MRVPFVALFASVLVACGSSESSPAAQPDATSGDSESDSFVPVDATDSDTTSDAFFPDAYFDGLDDVWPEDTAGLAITHYEIRIDPTAPEGKPVRVVPIFGVKPDAGDAGPAPSSNMSAASHLTGLGTYDPTTKTFIATLRLTNTGTTNWDEPVLKTTSYSSIGSTDLTFGSAPGQDGTLVGDGTVGSAWAFSDISAAGGKKSDAWQKIRIADSKGIAATIRVEVEAFQGNDNIAVDSDDDSWNDEAGEPAGGDCNDADKTKFPGGAACSCLASCSGAPSAPSCAAGACCSDACSGSSCARSCPTGCTCAETFTSTGANTMSCDASSVCHVVAVDQSQTNITSCGAGAHCDLACSRTGATDVACVIESCSNARCAIRATGTIKLAELQSCTGGANCSIACSAGSDCRATCDGSSTCRLTNCNAPGASCTLTCGTGDPTDCGGGVRVCGGPTGC